MPLQTTPQFKAVRWRMLLSSLGVIGFTLTLFGAAVYQFVAYSLAQKRDRDLFNLADAAAHSLPIILQDQSAFQREPDQTLDNDGDLDIPWQNLRQNQQSIEWFDPQGHVRGKAGRFFPKHPFVPRLQIQQQGEFRVLILPVHSDQKNKNKKVQGYVRVSTSNDEINEELERLRFGLAWSSLGAVAFCGIGSWWLMRQALQPLEHSFRQLKQFTADASHELRNPLTGIKTSIEVLQSHPERINAIDAPKVRAIASATDQMTQIVEDLLLLARTDGNLPTTTVWTTLPLNELLEDLVDWFLPQADAKAISFKFIPGTPAAVRGDVTQLKRLFSNLLSNALQYTPANGTITLRLEIESDWVVVAVEDTGIGIAPESIDRVFDRFWRADQARSHRVGGTGLGLAIAQSITHAHHGRISVKSQLGVGSCFQVKLPLIL